MLTQAFWSEVGEGANPLEPTNGTLVINGDLDADIVVNGNIQVSGNISGRAIATGTIAYGSLSGSVKANASVSKCDISVDEGTLTFAAGASVNDEGALYTTGMVTNDEGTTTVIWCDLTIAATSASGFYNYATITAFGAITVSGTSRGVYNSSATMTISGVMNVHGGSYGLYNTGATSKLTIASDGVVTVEAASSTSYGVYNASSATMVVAGMLVTTGKTYAVYNTSNAVYIVEDGASVTYNGDTYGI